MVIYTTQLKRLILSDHIPTKTKLIQCSPAGDEISVVESLQLDLHTIEAATNNFSNGNKTGEGGFGSVYKVRKYPFLFFFKLE